MELNPVLVVKYHKALLGGGAWSKKIRKTFQEKYFLSRAPYKQMEAPTLRGTKLNMGIKGSNFIPLSKPSSSLTSKQGMLSS